MDIDFHYYATYVAARFAGYPASQALTIARAAQTIDENGRHVLVENKTNMVTGVRGVPDDFEIRADPDGPALHTYRVLMTFQGLGDIGTSGNDTIASIWPVFHFLPGNFIPNRLGMMPSKPSTSVQCIDRRGPAVFKSDRWSQREFSGQGKTSEVEKRFRWLCRPHSPLAVGLVNNATDMIHDRRSVVALHDLGLYLVGATMHVFIDTWAHQDFVGPASRSINAVSGAPSIAFLPQGRRALPILTEGADFSTAIPVALTPTEWRETAQAFNWIAGHGITSGGTEEKNIYVGHGQVGHWPDHSALVWQYHPNWSGTPITRSNPVVYFDAFVHMVWAMYCIRNNKQYIPFDINEQTVSSVCMTVGITGDQLRAVYTLFSKQRDPWGRQDDPAVPAAISDIWDRDIYAFGREWREAIAGDIGLAEDPEVPAWLPGKSSWVVEAADAHFSNQQLVAEKKANSGTWYSVAQFTTLPFFKFNLAAKCHYRFVKQELLAFGEKLLGDWPDGAAYADDLSFATMSRAGWLSDVLNTLGAIQRTTELQGLSEGMAVLLDEIRLGLDGVATELVQVSFVLAKLRDVEAAVDSEARFTYGIRDGDDNEISSRVRGIAGADALASIKTLIGKLASREATLKGPGAAVAAAVSGGAVTLLSYSDWKEESSAYFSTRSADPELALLDAAYKYLMEYLGGARRLRAEDAQAMARAEMVHEACSDWLEAGRGAKGRRPAILRLKTQIEACRARR